MAGCQRCLVCGWRLRSEMVALSNTLYPYNLIYLMINYIINDFKVGHFEFVISYNSSTIF